jgi:hypothetical protein
MTTIRAVIRDRRIDVPAPSDLPDGTEVLLTIGTDGPDEELEEGWDNSPEGIAAWLKWYDSLQPLIFTPEEEADTQAWLKKRVFPRSCGSLPSDLAPKSLGKPQRGARQ